MTGETDPQQDPASKPDETRAADENGSTDPQLGPTVAPGPPSAGSRARVFLRRHPAAVLGAAAVVVLLVVFSVVTAIQAQQVARERDRANRDAAAAQQVSNFLVSLFEVA